MFFYALCKDNCFGGHAPAVSRTSLDNLIVGATPDTEIHERALLCTVDLTKGIELELLSPICKIKMAQILKTLQVGVVMVLLPFLTILLLIKPLVLVCKEEGAQFSFQKHQQVNVMMMINVSLTLNC